MILLPYVTPAIAMSSGWLWMFNPQYGVLNALLGWLGVPPSQWMLSPRMAPSSVALYSLWHGLGFDVVIVLSAVSSVPKAVLEAGTIDSASAWQRFRRVTIPMLSPTLSFWSSSPLQAACRRSRRFLPRLAAQVVPIMAPPHCCC